jgi:hypothetical protein
VIDTRTMTDLRMGSTLVHALPGIVLHVDSRLSTLRVGHGLTGDGHTFSACGFRVAVARAYQLFQAGRPVELTGLEAHERPCLTLSAGDDHRILPGGLCLVSDGDTCRVVAATVLPQERCREELLVDGATPGDSVPLALHWDDATEVTLIHTHPDDEGLDLAIRAVEAAFARCAAAELLDEVSPSRSRR